VIAIHEHGEQRELDELDEAVASGDVTRIRAVLVVVVAAPGVKVLIVSRIDLGIAGVRFALELADDIDDDLAERAADPIMRAEVARVPHRLDAVLILLPALARRVADLPAAVAALPGFVAVAGKLNGAIRHLQSRQRAGDARHVAEGLRRGAELNRRDLPGAHWAEKSVTATTPPRRSVVGETSPRSAMTRVLAASMLLSD
jgi:hypothetical protein